MKYIVLILFLLCSCLSIFEKDSEIQETLVKDTLNILPFPDTTTPSGIFLGYEENDSLIYLVVKKGQILKTISDGYSKKDISEIAPCNFYRLHSANDSMLIITRGCGFPPSIDSKLLLFRSNSVEMQDYGNILGMNEKKNHILHFEANSGQNFIVKNFLTNKADTIYFDQYFSMPYNFEPYILDNFGDRTPEKAGIFEFNMDTIFFNLMNKDSFLLYNLE